MATANEQNAPAAEQAPPQGKKQQQQATAPAPASSAPPPSSGRAPRVDWSRVPRRDATAPRPAPAALAAGAPNAAAAARKPAEVPASVKALQPLWAERGLKCCPYPGCGYPIEPKGGLCQNGGTAHGEAAPYTPKSPQNARTVVLKNTGGPNASGFSLDE